MSDMILDGTGKGYRLAIDKNNRAQTLSVSKTEMTDISTREGEAYIFASGPFTSITTTGVEHGFMYIKNTSTTKELHIDNIRTCGETIQKWRLYKGVTAGTLVSGATDGISNNINLTKANQAEVTVYIGSDGSTITDGTMIEHWINDVGHSNEEFDGALVLGTNDTLALSLETDTAGDFCCRMIAYYEDKV